MCEALSIVWAERRQPSDEREALIEVHRRLNFDRKFFEQLPVQAEVEKQCGESDPACCCITRESFLSHLKHSAIHAIDSYLAQSSIPWRPRMWKPSLPMFVERPVRWRSQGKC